MTDQNNTQIIDGYVYYKNFLTNEKIPFKDSVFIKFINFQNCETLTYEIKTNINSNANTKINSLSYLLNCLEENKAHLKYLEIYINNDEYSPINVKDFTLIIPMVKNQHIIKLMLIIQRGELKESPIVLN